MALIAGFDRSTVNLGKGRSATAIVLLRAISFGRGRDAGENNAKLLLNNHCNNALCPDSLFPTLFYGLLTSASTPTNGRGPATSISTADKSQILGRATRWCAVLDCAVQTWKHKSQIERPYHILAV